MIQERIFRENHVGIFPKSNGKIIKKIKIIKNKEEGTAIMSLGYALVRVHNKLKKYNNTTKNKDNLTTKPKTQ